MTESIEDSSSSNDEILIDNDEFNKLTSTLDEFTPVIPETVTKYYMKQCGLQTDDDRVVKLLSVSVQKFMSGIINDCYQLHKLREKSSNRTTAAAAQPATTESTASTTDQSTNAASGKKSTVPTNQTLTLNDLTHVLGEYGINVKKHFIIHDVDKRNFLIAKNIDSKRCKLQVWDTAGEDRFKSIASAFYRNANGIIICFDITDLDSFRNISNWIEEVKRYSSEQTPMFIIGTKSDLKPRRMVSNEMIKAYVEKNQLLYLETSSKTNENVEKCFIDFTRKLIEHTNQIELNHKTDGIYLDSKRKPVKDTRNSSFYGGNKCTI